MPWLHEPDEEIGHFGRHGRHVDDASDFSEPGSDGRLLAGRQKTLSEEIGKNEQNAHSVRFTRTRFLNLGRLDDVGQHLRRENLCV